MPSFNQVVLMGHLARDPELRYTPQGVAVSDFTVATNRKFTRSNGEKAEEVAFVDVTVWNKLAEICAEFLKKGRAVLVSGRLVQDRWEDETTGQKRSKLRVVGDTVQFIGGGSKDDATPAGDTAPEEAPAPAASTAAPAKGTNGSKVAKSRRQ